MVELKTLKDIEFDPYSWQEDFKNPNESIADKITKKNKELLRSEAIKWIKEFEGKPVKLTEEERETVFRHTGIHTDTITQITFSYLDKQPAIDWIKHFFNITNEELKI